MATTTLAEVEAAVFADPRLHARITVLERRRDLAEAAYDLMVALTERAALRLADRGDDVGLPPGDGVLGEAELGEQLVAAETAARDAVRDTREYAHRLVRWSLELVQEHYQSDATIVDVDDRSAGAWVSIVVHHVTRAGRGMHGRRVVIF